MINKIRVNNFKSLKDIEIETTSLNLFAGLNGMGKSSLLQIILLLKQSLERGAPGLLLNGPIVNIGKGKDALYQFAKEEFIEFGLDFKDNSGYTMKFIYKPEANMLELADSNLSIYFVSDRDRFLHLHYLKADHIGPQDIYETHTGIISNNDLGDRGEYTVHFLHAFGYSRKVAKSLLHPSFKDPSLINQVNGWLTEISPGVRLNVIEVPHVDKVLLNYEFELAKGKTSAFKPSNVGFGISFVLPVITSLLIAGKGKTIIIENPESHIHPNGQAALGKLMALAAANGAQLFVETHSDHIINGVRVAVKEGLIDKQDVSIYFFDKVTTETEQYTEVAKIKIDKRGELSDYPKNFLDTWSHQLLKLI
ncbi:MAG: DUF3696 domain-containing protein [Bacteroidales bacterium]|nr:DUF3696 domain-containing protein [Bacteroidales bacterium]